MKKEPKRNDLIYPELSYTISGCAFSVFNSLGPGHLEKVYQKAIAIALNTAGLNFHEQESVEVFYNNYSVGKGYVDFLVEEKIIIELKREIKSGRAYIKQVLNYLHSRRIPLAILINFTPTGVLIKRILAEEYYHKT